jgi:hypothetical protein
VEAVKGIVTDSKSVCIQALQYPNLKSTYEKNFYHREASTTCRKHYTTSGWRRAKKKKNVITKMTVILNPFYTAVILTGPILDYFW